MGAGAQAFLALLRDAFHPAADRAFGDTESFGYFFVRPPVALEF
jgi:hypothetical protein